MKIRYVGVHDAVTIFVGDVEVTVANSAQVEVSAAVAGRPPEARVAACEAELVAATAARDHARAAALRDEWTTLDHGAGLLAQVGNWQAVATKAAKSGDEEAGK